MDFDWFYRKPMIIILMWLSSLVFRIFSRFDRTYNTFYDRIRLMLSDPGKVFSGIAVLREDADGEVEEERPVGEFMQTFIIFCIIAFFVLLIIE